MRRFVGLALAAAALLSMVSSVSVQAANPRAEALLSRCSPELNAVISAYHRGNSHLPLEDVRNTWMKYADNAVAQVMATQPGSLNDYYTSYMNSSAMSARSFGAEYFVPKRDLLDACLVKARIEGLTQEARSADAGKGDEPPSAGQCSAEQSASINAALDAIDQRIASFLESPAGQQTGAATPSLQVVMWGTSQQASVLRKCGNAEAFGKRLEELNAAFDAAKRACLQLQSGGRSDMCGPVAPENIL